MRFGIILVLFLISACAQVGVLNGGPDDEFAPQPNMEKMTPRNASTSFSGKQIVIPFDEFIKLKNPSETIIVVPPNIKPIAKIKKKSLVLSWEEDLLPNTTYAFYLNGTVQDTRESNDSLMTFVFSTGDYIDSLSAEFFVRDAFSNDPVKGIIIGLYENYSDTIRPTYFAQTADDGKATLSYLKAGKYDVVAFSDKNKDLKHQVDEAIGFKIKTVNLTGVYADSIPIRIYLPQQKPKITNFTFNAPGSFIVAANRNLENATFSINGNDVPKDNSIYFSSDSLLLPFTTNDSSIYTLVVNSDWVDTSSIRLTQKEKAMPQTLQFEKGADLLPNQPAILISSSEILSVLAPLISVQNAADSSNLIIRSLNSLGNKLELNFDRDDVINANIIFLPGAIVGKTGPNSDTLLIKTKCLTVKELGNLEVNVAEFTEAIVLEILLGKQLIESVPMAKDVRLHQFNNLKPGEYFFRIIYDKNENGRWDVGNRDLKIQPEFVELFPEMQKVRANWNLEVVLKKAGNGEE